MVYLGCFVALALQIVVTNALYNFLIKRVDVKYEELKKRKNTITSNYVRISRRRPDKWDLKV